MNPTRLLDGLRRANRGVATAVGVMLAVTAAFIIADITFRQFGRSLGGSDEISGYAMAITASWGLGYALLERAHVRIDILHRRLPGGPRALLDIVAIAALALTVALVAFQCWPVLEKSLSRGSRANTPLETPLWIPQSLWFGGWVWFAGCALVMLGAAIALLAARRREPFDTWFAATDEVAALAAESPLPTRGAADSPSLDEGGDSGLDGEGRARAPLAGSGTRGSDHGSPDDDTGDER